MADQQATPDLLCLLLAETMVPERTGGSQRYAYPAFRDRWLRAAKHINGVTACSGARGRRAGARARRDRRPPRM